MHIKGAVPQGSTFSGMKFLFALLGVAVATYSSLPLNQPLTPKTEYLFRFESTIASGIPSGSDESLTNCHCDARVQMTNDRSAILGLENCEVAHSNKLAVSNKKINFDALEKREITAEHKRFLELPVAFHYKNGLVSDLQFTQEEPVWTANVKRSVLNMLQINLNKISSTKNKDMEIEKNAELSATFEKTIEGDCEVIYTTISSEEKNTVVTKSVNFDKCSRRADIRYHMRFASECPECKHSKAVLPQTVYTYTFAKEELKQVEARSVYQVTLKDQQLMKSEFRTLLTLVESTPIRREMQTPRGEKQELIYSTQWDQVIERFYKNGDDVEEKPFPESEKKITEIKQTLERLDQVEEHRPESLEMIQHLVQSLRKCSESELRKVHDETMPQLNKKTQDILEQSLAIAGTKNTIQHLVGHIENGEIIPMRASQLFKSIQETLYPSEKIAHLIYEFSTTEVCRRSPILRQSVWLSYGAIVRGVISPSMEIHLVKEDSLNLKNKFLTVFKREYEKSRSTYDKVLIIKSMANAALDVTVFELERIILNKKEESVVRREAIDALRLIGERMPRKVQRLLMPVYSDRLERSEIRMSALVQLLQSKPEFSVLSQLVSFMEREPNHHVAAMTYRLLNTISKSTNPCESRLASDMKAVLRTSLFRPQENIYSRFEKLPIFSYEALSGVNFNFASVFGMESAVPKELMASMDTLFSGDWSKYFMQIGFSQQNIEQLYNKIVRVVEKMRKEEDLRQPVRETLTYLKTLAQKMNIKSRKMNEEEPFTMLYFRYKQMDYAIIPLDEQVLEELVGEYLRNGFLDINRLFNMDTTFNFAHTGFFFEYTHQIPTILGVPLRVIAGSPTVFSAEGKFSLKKTSYGVTASIVAKPTVAMSHIVQMKTFSPIMEQGVKIVKDIQSSLPLNLELEVTMKRGFEVTIRQSLSGSKKTLLNLSSRPSAYVRIPSKNVYAYVDVESKTIQLPSWEQKHQEFEKSVQVYEHNFVAAGVYPTRWNLKNILLGEYEWTVEVEPTRSAPKDIVVRLAFEPVEETRLESATVEKMMEKKFEIEDEEWTTKDSVARREHIQKFARGLVEGFKHRMVVSLEAGRKISEFELRSEIEKELKFARFSLNSRVPTEDREWTVKSVLEVLMPEPVSTLAQVKDQKHKEILAHWESKWGSSDKNELIVKVQLDQNKQLRNWIKTLENESEGLSTYDIIVKAARLNQLKAVMDYKLAPQTEKYLTRIFDVVKSYTFWSSKLEKTEGEPRRVFVHMTVQPTRSYATINVQTPEQLWKMTEVELPMVVLPTIARVSSKSEIKKITSSECVVKSTKIASFDNVIYKAPLTTCYSVVAKDCSEEPRYAVLVRKVSRSGEEKKLKIVAESTYELELIEDELVVSVNGKKIQRDSEFTANRIEKINSNLFVIELDDITVHFDGYTVKMQLNKSKMNTQCGLCGHFDGEKQSDFRTAYDDETEDIESFHRSFLVKHEDCTIEEEKLSEKKNYKIYENEYEEYQQSPMDYESKNEENREPVEITRLFEQKGQLCFSVEPVAECPKNTLPKSPMSKKVDFNCVSRDSVTARTIKSTLARTPILRALPNSHRMTTLTRTVSVPRSCEVY